VTLFNRGRLETMRKEKGRPSTVPEGVEVLYGNRDPEKTADEDWKKLEERDAKSPKGLSQLEGKKWDAAIDTSAFFPRMAQASAELLAPSIKQYILISTISVYKDNSKPGADETAELVQLKDPKSEDMGKDYENYGGGKAACEAAVEKAMKGRVATIRPGFIVGPRDTSARFIYWPLRVRRGGDMLVPGEPADPIQIIDVRDLAEWIVHCIETNTVGTFNATGPDKELSMKAMVEGCKEGAGGDPITYTWVPSEFLEKHEVGEGELPLWLPPTGQYAGFHRVSISRALGAGLKFRPVSDTAKATLAWYDPLPDDVKKAVGKAQITPEREATLLEDFKKSKG
jgi:2'-hydroxyisoflavone reductase